MKKQYRELDFLGYDIDHVMKEMSKYKEKNQLVFVEFNGEIIL